MTGYWSIDVPIGPEIVDVDQPLLEKLSAAVPDGVSIRTMEVVLNGRIWRWRAASIDEMVHADSDLHFVGITRPVVG